MNEHNAEFETIYREALDYFAPDTEEEKQILRADLALGFQYPGQFVAYIDCWHGPGPGKKAPLERTLIAHDSELLVVQAKLAEHPEGERAHVRYVEGPGDGLDEALLGAEAFQSGEAS